MAMATDFEVQENAFPEPAEGEDAERLDAVSTAVQWVNETITQDLQGLAPSSQAEVDQVLRSVFHLERQVSSINHCLFSFHFTCQSNRSGIPLGTVG